eukprot:CAMPEP_0184335156 /NCGR_PEP_ID=MMETSP1089-20130417/3771_1 /TAXON_ID=38269 ORGANISM="Gloeochaete wittrockiana, Strain SAG46.84" /NCGR_SAMPLE_ID=MMETSP1089 /ASSEMBLY_ACC=CAM_ASM_000445 /LENGTH=788 /DNA_ID=CAMNT_0026659689 /DNA_START=49 /DNA_END=2412 /DNA_ORIENTATION=+
MNWDEFRAAVAYAFNPAADPAIHRQANTYLEQIKQHPDAWKIAVEQIVSVASSPPEVAFWCLQLLLESLNRRYGSFSPEDRAALRAALIHWIRDVCPARIDDPPFIKNKVVQCVVKVVEVDYPDAWPTFFSELLGAVSDGSAPHLDVLLRILDTIDEDVIALDHRTPADLARSARIKDAMRVQAVTDIVEIWYQILVAFHSTAPKIAQACLKTMSRYIVWIDINLVTSARFIPLFFGFLSVEQLRNEACGVLMEIVSKRMDSSSKLALYEHLGLLNVLRQVAPLWTQDPEKLAALVAALGNELLDVYDKAVSEPPPSVQQLQALVGKTESMITELLPLIFLFMEDEDDDCSASVLPFVHAYVAKLKRGGSVSQQQSEQLVRLLQAISKKLEYDDSAYDFDRQGEDEAAFQEYRKGLNTIFKNVVRLIPDGTRQYVHSNLDAVLSSLQAQAYALPFATVEAALTLVYQLGEALTEDMLKNADGEIGDMISSIIQCNVAAYPHMAVTLMVFENVVRYARTICARQNVMADILAAFLDQRGMRNSNPTVRGRVYYLFMRFVKTVRQSLQPFLDNILQGVQDLLVISNERVVRSGVGTPKSPLKTGVNNDDQLYLFEAVGMLLSSDLLPPHQQALYLKAILTPLVAGLEQIVAVQVATPGNRRGTAHAEAILSHIITSIGNLTKGFPVGSIAIAVGGGSGPRREETWALFKQVLDATLRVTFALPLNETLHSKMIFFLHRMVECLGADVLPQLPAVMVHLLTHCSMRELQSLLALYAQLAIRFKTLSFAVIN